MTINRIELSGRPAAQNPFMKAANPCTQTINGGSSRIKFALFEAGDSFAHILAGSIEQIGLPRVNMRVKVRNPGHADSLRRHRRERAANPRLDLQRARLSGD